MVSSQLVGLSWELCHNPFSTPLAQTGESTPGVTGWLEVSVDGTLVHSKKVSLLFSLSLFLAISVSFFFFFCKLTDNGCPVKGMRVH